MIHDSVSIIVYALRIRKVDQAYIYRKGIYVAYVGL